MTALRCAGPTCCRALVLAIVGVGVALGQEPSAAFEPIVVPRLWSDAALDGWATPLAGLGVRPGHYSEQEYYAAPVDNLRTYPVYHPDFEPPGYRDWMREQGPRRLIEPELLKTQEDWIEAGREVFEQLDTAVTRTSDPRAIAHFSDAAAFDAARDAGHDVVTGDGIVLDYRWVVDSDGELKLSLSSCAGCHTRLLPDGSLLPGAPSNFDLAASPASEIMLAKLRPSPPPAEAVAFYESYGVPWLDDDPHLPFRGMSDEELTRFFAQETGAPPGTTIERFNGSPLYTTRMADLRGVRDRRYLDTTGTHRNRGPEDVARYGIMVEFADSGVFGPHRMTPEVNQQLRVRPPDAAMYALGLYLYSLGPAPSPHAFDETAQRGQQVFEAEGCSECHEPPAYTNNALIPAPGFDPPADAADRGLRVSKRRVGTDPGLALKTRKGTGYYKVPSLRGLWYRGLFEHSGSVATLEDWFSRERLRDDYVPSGWRGPGVQRRAVPGHRFGLDLPEQDKVALIAFLKTL